MIDSIIETNIIKSEKVESHVIEIGKIIIQLISPTKIKIKPERWQKIEEKNGKEFIQSLNIKWQDESKMKMKLKNMKKTIKQNFPTDLRQSID